MQNLRNEEQMFNLILSIALNDDRIRAVILNGSRASPSAKKDKFQDYDIVYLVTEVESFVNDTDWVKQFGEMLIMQTPDVMEGKWPQTKDEFAYLMQFKDGNRIDLTLLHTSKLPTMWKDSQSILLLDKDKVIQPFDAPSDKDYLPKPPTEKEFHDCCNEFLWVATYVAKGIWRKEFTYAKYVSEQIVKEQLIKLLTWQAGLKTDYQKTIGKYGKHLQQYLEPALWNRFLATYVDADYANMWKSLFTMCDIFNEMALALSSHFGYQYNQNEYREVVAYLKMIEQLAD